MTAPELPAYAQIARRHDADRFLAALFAPQEHRDTLFLLTAFNHELARAREVASQPMLALIRLQWWREVVEGARRQHEVAGPLGDAIVSGRLDAADLGALVDAREAETEEAIGTRAAFEAYVRGTAGGFAATAGRLLGADAATRERLAALGAAYGIAGQIRSVGVLARQGRCLLPADLLAEHGLDPATVIAAPGGALVAPVLAALAAEGRRWLALGQGRFSREVVAAALPAVLAARDLRRPAARPVPHGVADRLAMTVAAMRSRV